MFKWQFNECIETDATAQQIWSLWEDVENWPKWDKEISWVKLKGPFLQGTHGQMKPLEGPKVDFIIIEVEKNKKFTDRAKLPLTTIDFSHTYYYSYRKEGKAYIKHSIEMKGFFAPIFGFIIGRKIKKHLKQSMLELSKLALVK